MSTDQQRRWGDNVDRGRTIERVVADRWPLDRTGQSGHTAWWHDARTRAPIMPRRGFGTITPGTPVEVKGCQLWTHDHGRRGRWLVREHCHERLVEEDGEYLLVVYRDGGDRGGRGSGDPHRALGARLAARLPDRELVSDLGARPGRASHADSLEPGVRLRRLRGYSGGSCMSSNHTTTESDASDGRTDADDQRDLETRVRDLEVEVYGREHEHVSAGQAVVVDLKKTVTFVNERNDGGGAPIEDVYAVAEVLGIDREVAQQAYQKLKRRGEVYEREQGVVRPI